MKNNPYSRYSPMVPGGCEYQVGVKWDAMAESLEWMEDALHHAWVSNEVMLRPHLTAISCIVSLRLARCK